MIKFPKTQNQDVINELARQKELASGKYDFDSAWTQLSADFHNKCYICGEKCTSPRIEHFRPHNGGSNVDRKFDWNNLMLACEHCNSIKSNDYENLIDCTSEQPDLHIRFAIGAEPEVGKHSVQIQKLPTSHIHDDTINLLEEVYSGTTKCKQIGASVIVSNLLAELNDFDDLLQEYQEEQNADALEDISWELNRESRFTAFKRWVVRDSDTYRPLFEALITDQ
ncbi:HNH endonuclease [Vibrio mediterranei]|uniref:HNH endonuclease n=1 Tax=Vibrio mediterranei TaxID=689 RepID=UPI001EFCED06|nr:HNH endonuclease [Vibrio mediterranei]MCG9624209.1 HNH endonuclease [Vibrio mediterranei]